jgi:hypothetical protein
MIAVSIASLAPPAISSKTTPVTLKLPDCAAAATDGNANVTIWPSTPPPTKPAMVFPNYPSIKERLGVNGTGRREGELLANRAR